MVVKQERELQPEIIWIGSQLKDVDVPAQLKSKAGNINFYQKCIVGPITVNVGDYVLISNSDAAEADSIDDCDIGLILHLYEAREDMTDRDPHRAYVQWYSWPKEIPHKFYDSDNISIDFNLEVIQEHRPYDNTICLENVFGKCCIVHGDIENSAETIANSYKGTHKKMSAYPMFVCRYKFIKIKNAYRLVPLEFVNKEPLAAHKDEKQLRVRRKSCVGGIESVTKSGGNSSARKSRRGAALAGIKKRRASVASFDALEFIDINELPKENKVSPIKIIGGRSIVRMSASEKKPPKAEMRDNKREVNGNYLMASPLAEKNIKMTPTSRASAARRNLNLSLDNNGANTTNESDYLNYSIVDTSGGDKSSKPNNEMKITLRVSERRNSTHTRAAHEDPLNIDTHTDNALLQRQRKRLSVVDHSTPNFNDIYHTPSKRSKENDGGVDATPTTRRKSILKSACRIRDEGTPRRSIQLSNIVEKRIFQEDEIISTPKRGRPKKTADTDCTPKKSTLQTSTRSPARSSSKRGNTTPPVTPSAKLKLLRAGEITPSIETRRDISTVKTHKSELQLARERLHVSVVPQSLPCREKEFDNIYTFLEGKIEDQCGGCMYISGVPGTGKTATVTGVIRTLQREAAEERLPEFEFLEINGMRLTEPRQAYVQIYKQLTGKTVSWEHAHTLLEKRFTTPAPRRVTTVLLVDELDILCNRRQDVVYNLLDWPTKSAARLVVVTIANTMDLPERLLMGKVTSRLGLTRLTFQPYTHKQLQDIVTARLSGSEAFKGDAVQLVARKVAAVSGDARRALDICRRATEIADASASNANGQKIVSMLHVQQAFAEMIASAKVQAIKNCSRLEQMFLQAVVAEVTRTGVEETSFMGVYSQIESIAAFMGVTVPAPGRTLRICSKLGAERLIICEHSRNDIFQKILLNVSMDDIHYALRVNAANGN